MKNQLELVDLPTGKLRDLLDFHRVSVNPDDIDPAQPYVGLEHITSGTGEWTSVPVGEVELKSAKFRFSAGDILFGKLRPNLRKCVVVDVDGVCSTDILPLTPKNPDDAFLLSLLMRSHQFASMVASRVGGASLPRISASDLLDMAIPVLPPEKAARLHELSRQISEARSLLRKLDGAVIRLEESVAQQAWGSAATSAEVVS